MSALHGLAFDQESLHRAYGTGMDPAQVIEEAYRRIEALADPGIFLHLVDPAIARDQASALPPFDPVRQPLWGLPFAVKDNIDMAGTPTTAACPEFTYDAKDDAFVVCALRRAGAIPIGKTNLDQFATGLVGLRTPYPAPRNAIDAALAPGGSSSGSGVAVAQGLVSFALGTDTAGSGRVPAALNNIVGLKPSLGAISARGVVPACRTLDTVSVLALTVADAYAVFRCAAQYDPQDPFARVMDVLPLRAAPARPRVGVAERRSLEFFGDTREADSYDAAIAAIGKCGADVVTLDITLLHEVAGMLYDGAWVAERFTVVEQLLIDNPAALYPVTRQIIEQASRFSAADAFRDTYRLRALQRRVAVLLEDIDVLCVPSIPTQYTVEEVLADPVGTNARLGTYTNFVNLLDLCGVAVPVAARSDGRAGSVTLLARAGHDRETAALAATLQQATGTTLGATGWPLPPPATSTNAPDAHEFPLAVVGAHMSGLPLNPELVRLGARYLCDARTAAGYRLFRLEGGPPFRPGLVRSDQGSAIALEIWALPRVRFGDFMAGIPAPLGIGTLNLDDGRQVKGFICETHGLDGALDITRHGGWRAYLADLERCGPAAPPPEPST